MNWPADDVVHSTHNRFSMCWAVFVQLINYYFITFIPTLLPHLSKRTHICQLLWKKGNFVSVCRQFLEVRWWGVGGDGWVAWTQGKHCTCKEMQHTSSSFNAPMDEGRERSLLLLGLSQLGNVRRCTECQLVNHSRVEITDSTSRQFRANRSLHKQ